MILARQSEEVVYVLRRRAITQSKIFIWTPITIRGAPLAAIVPVEDLRLMNELEEQIDIDDAWEARNESGENISWEQLRKELDF